MSPEIYEVVSQGARYWFLFLLVIIVWRSYRWLARDRKQRKKRLRLLPDAGYIGEMVVQIGSETFPQGTVLPVPREGILGSVRSCDLAVPVPGVFQKHLWFRYEDNYGVVVRPLGRHQLSVDGLPCENRRRGLCMMHGSRLAVGDAVLRLRMFAGFETTTPMVFKAESAPPPPEKSDADQSVAAMTAEQLALWQQQYWMMASQAMAAQAVMARAQADADAFPPEEAAALFPDEEGYAPEDLAQEEVPPSAPSGAYVVLNDNGTPVPMEEELDNETFFVPSEVFYPPIRDENADDWPYAPYPQSSASFTDQGYTYPESLDEPEEEDEDLTDAAAPPKSLYLEPDEAEHAKRVLWDKYLGGGRRR